MDDRYGFSTQKFMSVFKAALIASHVITVSMLDDTATPHVPSAVSVCIAEISVATPTSGKNLRGMLADLDLIGLSSELRVF